MINDITFNQRVIFVLILNTLLYLFKMDQILDINNLGIVFFSPLNKEV